MQVCLIEADQVIALPELGKFAASLKFTAPEAKWAHMTKDLDTVPRVGDGQIPLFFLDKGREDQADVMWRNMPGATKIKVKDGPRAGWVGYYKWAERPKGVKK